MTVASPDNLPEGGFNALAPELDVTDLAASLSFWCGLLGFTVAYARPENGFAYLEREGAQVMLAIAEGNWQTGEPEPPLGRGINLQITARAVAPILAALGRELIRGFGSGRGSSGFPPVWRCRWLGLI